MRKIWGKVRVQNSDREAAKFVGFLRSRNWAKKFGTSGRLRELQSLLFEAAKNMETPYILGLYVKLIRRDVPFYSPLMRDMKTWENKYAINARGLLSLLLQINYLLFISEQFVIN